MGDWTLLILSYVGWLPGAALIYVGSKISGDKWLFIMIKSIKIILLSILFSLPQNSFSETNLTPWNFKITTSDNLIYAGHSTIDIVKELCPKLLPLENPFWFIWNLKSSFESWKFNFNLKKYYISCLKNYFKHGSYGVVPCACIQVCHVLRLNTCTLNHSAQGGAKSTFEINFQTG